MLGPNPSDIDLPCMGQGLDSGSMEGKKEGCGLNKGAQNPVIIMMGVCV